ncbi:MAG: carbamate kinase [Proteobacteria bacterium]|nr:carbamate kinase [Pseudomonadota bacterium]
MEKLAVVAIGGNSLIKDRGHRRVEDQYHAIEETVVNLVDIIESGYNILVTHGNGAQVGFIQRRSEIAYKHAGLHFVPLVSCVADTQGAIGYQIQQALTNEFLKRGIRRQAVTVVTQVRVDENDPAFENPSKPIGTFFTKDEVGEIQTANPGWQLIEDSGRGFRRVVPSPKPIEIMEIDAIRTLKDKQFCVVSVGGGGIPVMKTADGKLKGLDAVIDKDNASSILAVELKAELLIISTGVEKIYLNFGKADQKPLNQISVNEAVQYIKEGHFAEGSMLPKMEAIVSFLKKGGKKAIISKPEDLKNALLGKAGTCITRGKS